MYQLHVRGGHDGSRPRLHFMTRMMLFGSLVQVLWSQANDNLVVAAFSSQPTRWIRTSPTSSSSSLAASPLPSIMNPITNRKIALGGPAYNSLLREGKWVQHGGTLQRLDLELLRSYQEEIEKDHPSDMDASTTTSTRESKFDVTSTVDEWYPVVPLPVRQVPPTTKDVNSVINNSDLLPLSQNQQDKLQKALLFVHKPSGVHCVPARDVAIPSLATCIQTSAHHNANAAKPCHRLDRDTSGIVLFGLDPATHAAISRQFEARTVSKTYLALVAGHPQEDVGTVDMAIGKQKTVEGFNRWALLTGDTDKDNDIVKARDAITNWKVQKRWTVDGVKFARVELHPQTGRGHQLRLHMKAIGHPLLGDTLHAPEAVAYCAPRLCLHAYRLQVDWNGVRLEASSVAPF